MMSAHLFEDGLTDNVNSGTPRNVIVGYILSVIMGCIGAMAGGFVAYIYRVGEIDITTGRVQLEAGGWLPVIGGIVGFASFFSVTWCSSGPGEYHYNWILSTVTPPSASRIKTVGLHSFDIYVTVHRVKNVYNTDPLLGLFGYGSNPYVEVMVGRLVDDQQEFMMHRNTTQRTCIARNNAFEECFHFTVSPTDDTIRFILFDQDVFNDDRVGMCDIDITDEVLSLGFPQKKSYKMRRGEGRRGGRENMDMAEVQGEANRLAGSIVVSFAPGNNFPIGAGHSIRRAAPSAWQHMQTAQQDLSSKAAKSAGAYGTWATATA